MGAYLLSDSQAIITTSSSDPEWILNTFPLSWECELLPDPIETGNTYTPRILNPGRQVLGAKIHGVQVSVSGALDAVEEIRRVFAAQGTLNGKRCRRGYVFLITIKDLPTGASVRAPHIQDAIARAQSPQAPDQLGLL